MDADDLMMIALDAGAEDFNEEEDCFDFCDDDLSFFIEHVRYTTLCTDASMTFCECISDICSSTDCFEVLTSPDDFEAVRSALEAENIPMAEAEVTMIPQLCTDASMTFCECISDICSSTVFVIC